MGDSDLDSRLGIFFRVGRTKTVKHEILPPNFFVFRNFQPITNISLQSIEA